MKNTFTKFENSFKQYINNSFYKHFSHLLDSHPLYISDFFKSIHPKIQADLYPFDTEHQPKFPIFNKNFQVFHSTQEIISTSEIEYTFSFKHEITPYYCPVKLYFQYFDVLSQNLYLKLLTFLIPQKDLNQPIIDIQFKKTHKEIIGIEWPEYIITLHFKNISDMTIVDIFQQFFWNHLQEQSQILAKQSLELYHNYTRNPETQKLILSTHFLNK